MNIYEIIGQQQVEIYALRIRVQELEKELEERPPPQKEEAEDK